MKKQTRILGIAALAVAATLIWTVSSTVAQMPGGIGCGDGPPGRAFGHGGFGGGPGGMGFERLEALVEELELTEEQQAEIKTIREQVETRRVEFKKQMMRMRNQLNGILLEDEPDTNAALRLAQQLGDVRTDMQVFALEQRLAIRKVLTPEQRDQLLGMRHQMGRRHGGRGDGERRGRGQGQRGWRGDDDQ